jgi:hypothetical protein
MFTIMSFAFFRCSGLIDTLFHSHGSNESAANTTGPLKFSSHLILALAAIATDATVAVHGIEDVLAMAANESKAF